MKKLGFSLVISGLYTFLYALEINITLLYFIACYLIILGMIIIIDVLFYHEKIIKILLKPEGE